MFEAAGGVSFPVVFSDGETETDIGSVVVYAALEYKLFLSLMSNKIGISPHQFTVFLCSPATPQRIPITGNVNFGSLSREKNCFFLVELRRSRRERRRKNRQFQTASFGDQKPVNKNLSLENVMLLRRGMEMETVAGFGFPFAGRVEYENRVRELQMEKERYLMNMGLGRCDGFGVGLGLNKIGVGAAICEECERAKEMGIDVGFHWCAYDAVTFGFRSPAGPISRPVKGSG